MMKVQWSTERSDAVQDDKLLHSMDVRLIPVRFIRGFDILVKDAFADYARFVNL